MTSGARVDGVVLAAGRSSRMGRPKPLLGFRNDTFLDHAIGVLLRGGCRSVLAVVNTADEAVGDAARAAGARVVVNEDPRSEQLDSVRLAIAALPSDTDAIAVLPVDMPLLRESTVSAVIEAFRERRAPIVVPVDGGVPGHPILLARDTFPQLLNTALPSGLRSLLDRHAERVHEVVVDDPGVIVDVDTPEQYARLESMQRPASRLRAADAARAALDAGERGADIVLVTILDPAELAGARLLVDGSGVVQGTYEDGELERLARDLAGEALAGGDPFTRAVEVSAGRRTLYVEAQRATERLVVVGAGHIAVPIARYGAELGFAVTVLDDREEFATEERFAPGVRVLHADFETDPFAGVTIDARTYVALVTRGHRWDFDCLRRLLEFPARPRYVGMIGSRRRVRAAFGALLEAGVPRGELARIHAPIGIEIGAESPEEIALSIAAEMVAVRRGVNTDSISRRERVLDRLLPERKVDHG